MFGKDHPHLQMPGAWVEVTEIHACTRDVGELDQPGRRAQLLRRIMKSSTRRENPV